LGDAMPARRLQDVELDREVVADEVAGRGVVRADPAHLGGGQVHLLRALRPEERLDLVRVREVELGARPQDQVPVACRLQPPDDPRADQPPVPGAPEARAGGPKKDATPRAGTSWPPSTSSRSCSASRRSWSTIMRTSSSKETCGDQPSTRLAFDA